MKRSYWRHLPVIWPYIRRHGRLVIAALILLAIASLISLAAPWPLALLVDGVLGKGRVPHFVAHLVGPTKSAQILFAVMAGVVISVVSGLVSLCSEAVNTRLERWMSLENRSDLYEHCQSLTQAFYDNKRTGDFMYRINFEAQALGEIAVALLPLAQSVLTLVGMFVVAAELDLKLALLSLSVTPLVYYASGTYGKYIEPRLVNVRNLEGESLGIVNETMSILRLTVSFNRQPYEYGRFRVQGEESVKARIRVTVAQMTFSMVVAICTAIGTALVLYIGAHDVVRGVLTVGDLIVLVSYIGSIYTPLHSISSTMATFSQQFIALEKSRELLGVQPDFVDSEDAVDVGRLQGRVTFDHVFFRYSSRKSTLEDISFDIPAGSKVAIVGPTGAGKSTLVGLIPRLYEVDSGQVLVDSIDVRNLTQRSLREQISIVSQEPLLFTGTISDNIRYGKPRASDEEVVEAAKAANAHDFISALPDGYNAVMSERGVNLSGGERQRICIARAMIKGAPIVILDEPTSSIDSRTEAVILEALDRLCRGRTTIMIAHRLSTVRDASHVLVLDKGRLVEQGTTEELMASDGLFRQLSELQRGSAPAEVPAATSSAATSSAALEPAALEPAALEPAASEPAASEPPGVEADTVWTASPASFGLRRRPRIVVLGMMSKMPVAGVVWQTMQYLVGLERLGCDAFYVEAHGRTPSMLMSSAQDDSAGKAADFLGATLARFGFAGRWAYHALHAGNDCYGIDLATLNRVYKEADVIVNLHGGTAPLPEHSETGRLIYVETDPVQLQIELHRRDRTASEFLEPHVAFFTFGENLGRPGCTLPVPVHFDFHPTRQPVVLDFWANSAAPGPRFTTVGNYRQNWREVEFDGEVLRWSKHHEFAKVMDLPSRTQQEFELALSALESGDKDHLESRGWKVVPAAERSADIDTYRAYIRGSRAEFTVAKEQNVRFRTGWFSDRSATYLASGRPVVTQDTGFGEVLPTGHGLFAFSDLEEAAAAVEAVASRPLHHGARALGLAREYFAHDVVLTQLLDQVGVSIPRSGSRRSRESPPAPKAAPADDLVLDPVRRRPLVLADETSDAIRGRPLPEPEHPSRTLPEVRSSIVVVTRDNLTLLRMCIESLLAGTNGDRWEVLVVDNGSTDGTPQYVTEVFRRFPRVRLLPNQRNHGFPAGVNQGLSAAVGETLVVLNDDTILPPGWLQRLRKHLEDPNIGLIGPVTNSAPNEARIPAAYSTYREFLRFAEQRSDEFEGQVRDMRVATMFCTAMSRRTFDKVGYLDEGYELGLFEDDDYSARVLQLGYRVVCAEDVFVHHFGEASFGKLIPGGEFAVQFEANRRRYEQKWQVTWQPHEHREDPEYDTTSEALLDLLDSAVPIGSEVLVISRGDPKLLQLANRRSRHFPGGPDGNWSGCHPADSDEAIRLLEVERTAGAGWLVIPGPSLWWLKHYDVFTRHLMENYRVVLVDKKGVVVDLVTKPAAPGEEVATAGSRGDGWNG